MPSHYITASRPAITIRAEKAESLSNALHGIAKLLEKNAVFRESAGPEPFMDGHLEGCMYEALNVISGAILELSNEIDMLAPPSSRDAEQTSCQTPKRCCVSSASACPTGGYPVSAKQQRDRVAQALKDMDHAEKILLKALATTDPHERLMLGLQFVAADEAVDHEALGGVADYPVPAEAVASLRDLKKEFSQ